MVVNRYTKLRWRRKLKRQQKSLEEASVNVGKSFDDLIINRWYNLKEVRRFVLGWLVLIALLIGGVTLQTRDLSAFYLTDTATEGGTYREGMVGQITDVNPIYATSAPDRSAASLIFSTLLKYDEEGQIVGDLAETWKVDKTGLIYTIKLRDNVLWHDGEILTADDVVFTYNLIQHPDTRSFLNESWREIQVQAKDDLTVTFKLPNEFTPFLDSLTVGGILPEHILGDSDPSQVRGLTFNTTEPIGTGPFKYEELRSLDRSTNILRMSANEEYFHGKPQLDAFVIKTFIDRDALLQNFLDGEIAAATDLSTGDREEVFKDADSIWYDMPLNNAVYVFLKTTNPLMKEKPVRKALVRATDQKEIAKMLESRYSLAKGPLLPTQLGFNADLIQPEFDLPRANEILDKAGWKMGEDGIRTKKGTRLSVDLVTQSSDDYDQVAKKLREQWRKAGINLNVLIVGENEIQQNHISPHNYQALLFGVTLGADPDVFPYWHSSQTKVGGFNLSEYSNTVVDEALESGRTLKDKKLREVKYQSFTTQWLEDAPAIALYQPGFSYVQRTKVDGLNNFRINTPDDRFTNVHKWKINTTLGEKAY